MNSMRMSDAGAQPESGDGASRLRRAKSVDTATSGGRARRNAVDFSRPPLLLSPAEISAMQQQAEMVPGQNGSIWRMQLQEYQRQASRIAQGQLEDADLAMWWRKRLQAEVAGMRWLGEAQERQKPAEKTIYPVKETGPGGRFDIKHVDRLIPKYEAAASKETEQWHPATGGDPERVRKMVPGWFATAEAKGWSPGSKFAHAFVRVMYSQEFAKGETTAGLKQQAVA